MYYRNHHNENDPYDLQRFVNAQEGVYERALSELQDGNKRTHWMWYIFPQITGLGHSIASKRYAIKSREEAWAYLEHPVLGRRLKECAQVLLELRSNSAPDIFGYPDTFKLKSCMTLFEQVSGNFDSVFSQVLEKYYDGERDKRTLKILERMEKEG